MDFVCTLWRGTGFWKRTATYGPQHVERLAAMLARHGGHALTVVHDGNFELPAGVRSVRMPAAVAELPDYLPKLWLWSPDLADAMDVDRFACVDLDVVILDDLAPVLATANHIRLWDAAVGEPYNTSLFTLTPGHGHQVWWRYSDAALAGARARAKRWTGDQSWVAHILGWGMPTFGEATGVFRYRPTKHRQAPPRGARAAFFCGPFCPQTESEHSEWVRANWK